MAFPTSPDDGQLYNSYVYNSTKSAWDKVDPGKYFDVGFIYTQYPGMDDPTTLGWYGAWTNVSSNFAGDFFRAEGGNATAFDSGEQADEIRSHDHPIEDLPTQLYRGGGLGTGTWYFAHGPGTTNKTGARGGAETRPVNQTIRIWKRTA